MSETIRSLQRTLAVVPAIIRFAAAILCVAAATLVIPATSHGDNLFVATGPVIGKYTTSGATVNASLISVNGATGFSGLAVSGSDLFVVNNANGTTGFTTVAEYTTSGATVNAALITLPNIVGGIAVSGSDLFVVNTTFGEIDEYTTSGAAVKALITGLSEPENIAVSGSDLFVTSIGADPSHQIVGKYTTSGATVNASLITESIGAFGGIAVSGSDLFVVQNTVVSKYTTSGATVNATLITGLNSGAIAVSGSNLFVSPGAGTIGEYTTSGATVNASLITGPFVSPNLIAVEPVPEPSSLLLVATGVVGLAVRRPKRSA